jgi:hypothetical protein
MTDERLYDAVGQEPMEDDVLEAAIAAYRADHPEADESGLRLMESRLRRLNDKARERSEEHAEVQRIIDQASDDGITMSWTVAERALRDERERVRRDQDAHLRRRARHYAEQEVTRPPLPRTPGRPPGSRAVGRDQIVAKYRELRNRLGRQPLQSELAANLDNVPVRTLYEWLKAYGLPWPIEDE